MIKEERERQKKRQAVAWNRIYHKFGIRSMEEMGDAVGVSKATISRALGHSNPILASRTTRLGMARLLGKRCGDEEELKWMLAETGLEMEEEEWREAQAQVARGRSVLRGAPRLSRGRMVGRSEEIDELRSWLLDERGRVEQTMVVCGVGGVGKTMLAARVVREREVWERYEDGVYWMRMGGQGEEHVIRQLAQMTGEANALRARDPWGVVAEGLRERRTLIVLDGVEGQIDLDRWGSVLPQAGRLLVTSRTRGLEGAWVRCRVLEVEGLGKLEAIELLTRGVKVDVSEEELEWVVRSFEGLPLGLCIGNRIGRWANGLSEFVREMKMEGIVTLEVGRRKDESVRVTFESSYRRLDEQDQELFRGLGVFMPWFEVEEIAAVLEMGEGDVRRGLRRLGRAGLVESVGPGEYEMHSLIHRYAVELGREDERWAGGMRRFVKYYLALGHEAAASGDLETLGKHLDQISQGVIYAYGMRDRSTLKAYVQCLGPYLSFGEESMLEDWGKWIEERPNEGERTSGKLRLARFRLRLGQPEEALRLARKVGDTPEGSLIEGEALLALGRAEEAAEQLRDPAWWERMAQLDAGDEMLFRAWALSERVRAVLGQEAGTIECWENAEAARVHWEAGQPSSKRAQLRLMRVAPLSEDSGKAVQALEERMELAEEVGERGTWLADALRRGYLLTRAGEVAQAEMAMEEIEEREAEMKDARFEPWVSLLRAHAAWAAGRDEAGEQAYQAAAEELAAVLGATVFWDVAREGETPEGAWRRALRVDDPFLRVEVVCEAYPLFAWSGEELPDEEDEQREEYAAMRDEMRWAGVELPGWDWLVG